MFFFKDALETTRFNYEAQMKGLYEHMAQQDAKIIDQLECIGRLQLSNKVETAINGNTQKIKESNGIAKIGFFFKRIGLGQGRYLRY